MIFNYYDLNFQILKAFQLFHVHHIEKQKKIDKFLEEKSIIKKSFLLKKNYKSSRI